MSDSAAATALRTQLQRVSRLHATRGQEPADSLAVLTEYQAARLRRTYADLAASPRYAAAARFFFDDLYGPHDFAQRDSDLERIYPMMVRLLPSRAVATVAAAMEVNALTQELDRAWVRALLREGPIDSTLTQARYARVYLRCDNREQRERQIELIGTVGRELDAVVKHPLIYSTLKMLRGPARVAGLGQLQDFLERGFAAFRAMKGADEFLAIIHARETEILHRIFSGDDRPFDP